MVHEVYTLQVLPWIQRGRGGDRGREGTMIIEEGGEGVGGCVCVWSGLVWTFFGGLDV